jgi:hypothetical protein
MKSILILLSLLSVTNGYVVTWDNTWSIFSSSATGTIDRNRCPRTAGEALFERNQENLLECSEKTLHDFYNKNDCCIVNIAECNYIEKAWWMSVNVLKHRPLCEYQKALRHPEHEKHYRRRSFLKRLKKRLRKAKVQ